MNLLWLAIVVPCTVSEPIALEIFKGTGRYLGTQLFTGFMYVAAAGCMAALRGWRVGVEEGRMSGVGGGSGRVRRVWEFGRRCFRWANV